MNHESITEIESLENQLPRWEKWLYLCYGASFTMFVNAIIRAVERNLLNRAFVWTAEELQRAKISSPDVLDKVYYNITGSLYDPGWHLVCYVLLLAALLPALALFTLPRWRKVAIHKRLNLIVGFFFSAWVVLLSLGVQDTLNVSDGYNFLLLGSAIVISAGYWWLRRKQTKAEVIFP